MNDHHKNNNQIVFQSGALSVSQHMLRFRGRRYKLAHIENLILKRPLFIMALMIGLCIAGFSLLNKDILFSHEITIAIGLALAIPFCAWPFGTLNIQSRTLSTQGGSITWFYADLAKAQNAIENLKTPSEL